MILRLPGCVLEVAAVLCRAFGVPWVSRAEVTINGLIQAAVAQLRVRLPADQSGRERRSSAVAGSSGQYLAVCSRGCCNTAVPGSCGACFDVYVIARKSKNVKV